MSISKWEVVGGGDKGGIVVREGQDLKSPQVERRLATGAVVEQLELVGQRLHYELVTGDGPDEGWVSTKLAGKDLLLLKKEGPTNVTDVSPFSQREPVKDYVTAKGVRVWLFNEGDATSPEVGEKSQVEMWYVGRLPGGAVFDCTRAKKGMEEVHKMNLGVGQSIVGMEDGILGLHAGAQAEIYIPNALGYGRQEMPPGVGNTIPAGSDLRFEIELLRVDGVVPSAEPPDASLPPPMDMLLADGELSHPPWFRNCKLPRPSLQYISFSRHLKAYGKEFLGKGALAKAKPLLKRTAKELEAWDGTGEACLTEVARDWPAVQDWSFESLRKCLSKDRVLVRWLGPGHPTERLWRVPALETSFAEYLDYIEALASADAACSEERAPALPRFSLVDLQFTLRHPELRAGVQLPCWSGDVTRQLIHMQDLLLENVQRALMGPLSPEEQQKQNVLREGRVEQEDWGMVKLSVFPPGGINKLHRDDNGLCTWLTQVQGQKLVVCYAAKDSDHLSLDVDPLDPNNTARWPGLKNATPFVAVLEAGVSMLVPAGWWRYEVALTPSITLTRSFLSLGTMSAWQERKENEIIKRTAAMLQVTGMGELKGKPLDELEEFCKVKVLGVAKKRTAKQMSTA